MYQIHKILITLSLFLPFAAHAQAGITINGQSLFNAPSLSEGQFGAYLVNTDGSAVNGSSFDFGVGDSLLDSATYGSSFELIGSSNVSSDFGQTFLPAGFTFNLTNGVDTGDSFLVVVFDQADNTSTVATVGSTYRIWTDSSWVVPSDGDTVTFNQGGLNRLTDAADFTAQVVPEPATYAFMLSVSFLIFAIYFRRKK